MRFPLPGFIKLISLKTGQSKSHNGNERSEGVSNVPGNASHISDLEILRNLTVNDQRDQGASASQPRAPLCVVCQERPQYSKAGGKYTTCGLSCAEKLQSGGGWSDTSARMPEGARDLPYLRAAKDDDTDDDLYSISSADVEAKITPDYYSDHDGNSQSIQPAPDGQSQSPSVHATQPYRPQSKPLPSAPVYQPQTPLCIVCRKRPPYSKEGRKYPTCGLTCAEKAVSMCCVCGTRPSYSKGSTKYLTCGLKCAAILKERESSQGGTSQTGNSQTLCIICKARPSYKEYPTCGLKCAEKLTNLCDYCHQKPKAQNDPHCGAPCQEMAKSACLVCRSRPKNGRYHFCGRTCRENARKLSPLILEVPNGHTTFDMVETKFQQSWKNGQPCPSVKKVYKVVEDSNFLVPYDKYKQQYGNESFRYHGTGRSCQLGDEGHATLCKSSSCAACSILKTSFQVSLANPGGAFGQGVYTSSASNKSASYTTCGLMFLTKVILGNVHSVSAFAEVKSLPSGCQSVVFDRMNGQLNETVVYTNEAIRPVFLIIFG